MQLTKTSSSVNCQNINLPSNYRHKNHKNEIYNDKNDTTNISITIVTVSATITTLILTAIKITIFRPIIWIITSISSRIIMAMTIKEGKYKWKNQS